MAFHWGHGIALFYSFFVCVLVIVVIQSRTFDNSLVTENYYARDINYQQEYDRRSNSAGLGAGPQVQASRLTFPDDLSSRVSGSVLIYRPSTKRHDRRLSLELDEAGGMDLPLAGLPGGYYQVIVEWSAGGVEYYDELDLYN
jgi:nitrogen fixation protein FixH